MEILENLTKEELKKVCQRISTQLDSISLKQSWSFAQYRESADEEEDYEIKTNAVTLLDFLSEHI